MVVTIGNAGGANGRATSITWTHNVATGSDRYMVVVIAVESAGSISSVDIAGNNFTFVRTDLIGTFGDLEIWELKEANFPASGNQTITVTPDAKRRTAAGSVGFAGVDQTTPRGTENSEIGNGTTQNVTVASAVDDVVVAVMGSKEQSTDAIASGETEQANFNEGNKASILLMTAPGAAGNVEMDTTMTTSGLDWRSTGYSVQAAGAGVTTYSIFQPTTLRVLVTQEIFKSTTLRVKVIDNQISLPTNLRVSVQVQIFQPTTLRVKVTQQTSIPSTLNVRVVDNQLSSPSNLRVTVQQQIFLSTSLRLLATQQVFLPSVLRVLVTQQTFLSTNLRVLLTSQISLPSQLSVVLGITTEQIFLPTQLRVLVTTQIFLPTTLRVIVSQSIFLPTKLRVNATQQIFQPTNLKVRGTESTFLPTNLRVAISNSILLPTTLKVKVIGQQTSLPTNLRILLTSQLSLPTTLRIAVSITIFLPTTLRINATQQLSLPSNLKIRSIESIFLPSSLNIRVGFTISLPSTLKVRAILETSLPSTIKVRVIDNQLSLPSTLRVILTTQLSLPSVLRVLVTQQISLPTSIRVKVLANQLVMPSSLRVALVTQISVPTSLRVKVIDNLISLLTTLRIKVVGQQTFLPTNIRVAVLANVNLPTKLRVLVTGQQLFLPSSLNVNIPGTIVIPTTLRVNIPLQLIMPTSLRVAIPPLFQIIDDDSDVGIVRKLMVQAGREVIRVHEDDIVPVFYDPNTGEYHIYTDFQDIMDIQHIRDADDITHSGTNYLEGSIVFDKEGKIDMALNPPDGTTELMITYATRDGLSDETIQLNVDMAKFYLQSELWRAELNYSGTSTYEQMAKWTLYTIATYWCILGMNSSNAIQSGYNYRIAEFEIQTKLWGEGMIAETLLNKYWERSMNMIKALKLFESNPEAPIYVVDRSNTKVPYNRDPTVFRTMTSMEAVTLHDSYSRYAIILKIWG